MANNSKKLVLCSVMIKPVRILVKDTILTWFDQIVRVPVHTFLVEESKIPLNPEELDGYWYCAGDFCDVDEAGVYQHIDEADISFARCLVSPNIKDDDSRRPKLVIQGEYGVNYVCHNIANRVLFSTNSKQTLGDIEIPKTGYSVVVKSALGVYGQNKVEWERRKTTCKFGSYDEESGRLHHSPDGGMTEDQESEIEKIHLAACGGDQVKSENLSYALKDIDGRFYLSTSEAIEEYDNGLINFEAFNRKMLNACSLLFSQTIEAVGLKIAKEIYPECNLDIEYDNIFEPPQKLMVTGG